MNENDYTTAKTEPLPSAAERERDDAPERSSERPKKEKKQKAKGGFFGRVKAFLIGLLIGALVGAGGFYVYQQQAAKNADTITAAAVFDRVVAENELVTASQNYIIVEHATDYIQLFNHNIPLTGNSLWYRYAGTIKAGVNMKNAQFKQDGTALTITLEQPYIISNTPDMELTGVLEEHNNLLNPIQVNDVDQLREMCVEKSEAEALEGTLMDEAKTNAEDNIRKIFETALGKGYTITFVWKQ